VANRLNQLYCDANWSIERAYTREEKGNNVNNTEMETILSKKIKEAEPTIDILGADRKVLQVAFQDLTNYLTFISHATNKEINLLDNSDTMEPLPKEGSLETESFLGVWTGIWLKKWKERFNLLIGQNNQTVLSKTSETVAKAGSLWIKLACRYELTGIVVSALIKNAEICGTTIIAENILKTELLCKQTDQDINNKEQTLAILSGALRRAREMAQRTGPLVLIKVDKSYYRQVNN
jgi:hypothetical protein